jgi:hypothetical protein
LRLLLFLLSVSLSCAGCYLAHEREIPREPPDASSPDASARDASAADAIVTSDAATACGPITTTIDVPAGGCTAQTITSTLGNACGRGDIGARQFVHVRRPAGGTRWYFLIRSRDPEATRIGAGLADTSDCTCRFQASVSGGDLTRHGIGGDLANTDAELDLVLDGDDRAIWLRMCDGPPR